MRIGTGSVAVVLTLFAGKVASETCGCGGIFPVEGTYAMAVDYAEHSTTEPIGYPSLQVLPSEDYEGCAKDILLVDEHRRFELSCVGGVYEGMAQMDTPDLLPVRIQPAQTRSSPMGGDMVERFTGVIAIPYGTPGFSGDFTLTLQKDAAAPECLCAEVRNFVGRARRIQEAYNDPEIMAFALENKLAGNNPGAKANSDLSDGYFLGYDTAKIEESFYDLVRAEFDEELNGANAVVEVLQSFEPLDGHVAAVASESCDILAPVKVASDGHCLPEIIRDAYYQHEVVHRRHCLALTERYGPSAYSVWTNHPPNLVLTETNAYDETVFVLEDWLGQYCKG